MDNLNAHSEHAVQPEGQQANGLPSAVPSQVLDTDVFGQQHINQSSFWFTLEQHRLQLDRILQFQNTQIRMSVQQEISMQNATLLNLLESVTSDVIYQSQAEIATLHRVLQRTQYHMGEVLQLAVEAYEINGSLICMLPTAQQETNSHVSSNEFEDEASSVARAEAETTKRDLICKVCNSGGACILLLPCHHLCACKSCGDHLVACPICGAAKDEAIEFTRSG